MTNTEGALILFIRNPEKGKVKTRLAKSVGEEQALEIYKALLDQTRKVSLAVPVRRLLFYSEHINQQDDWASEDFEKFLQQGNDLGERMHHAFLKALRLAAKAVIVGSDIAQIKPEIIQNAFTALDDHDYVIGPALDGGYYLLGMKTPSPELFSGIEWSTSTVCEETIAIIHQNGKTCAKVASLSDIDYAEDWEQYGWKL
ncbi:MAG: TIGR04282 family arsenosugar biosynthesis glycosyltransferase [Chitinophagales bacterium]|nr:TIGR04282 family arsenosugar biosynthesis glycosyltransferase [Chitinophagales bacterium]